MIIVINKYFIEVFKKNHKNPKYLRIICVTYMDIIYINVKNNDCNIIVLPHVEDHIGIYSLLRERLLCFKYLN